MFTGRPDLGPVLLDSLYIGGKDVATSLLRYRVEHQGRWENVAKVLNTDYTPQGPGDVNWTEIMQLLLINRMGQPGGKGMAQLAADLAKNEMRDLMGEVGVLLVFVTLYALRMAAAERPEHEPEPLPPADEIAILYTGFGSRLFDLFPLHGGSLDRWITAQQALTQGASQLPELNGIRLKFNRLTNREKDSVCMGALHSTFGQSAANKTSQAQEFAFTVGKTITPINPFDLRTVWWATSRLGDKDIEWTDLYEKKQAKKLDDAGRQAIKTDALSECLHIALECVGHSTFGKDWEPDANLCNELLADLPAQFGKACYMIQQNRDDAPAHPVRLVTDAMKDVVCALMEEPS